MLQKSKYMKFVTKSHTKPNYQKVYYPLEYFNIDIVQGCNSGCIMCHRWKTKITKLSFNAFKNIIKTMAPFMNKDKKIMLAISGDGEPMLNPDIFKMIDLSNKHGFYTTTITNSMLLTKNTAEKLILSNPNHINLSLESLDKETNDYIRGVDGHLSKVMTAIEFLHKYKKKYKSECTIGIHTTVCTQNITGIPDLVEWVNNNDKITTIRFQAVTQILGTQLINNWYKDEKYSFLWPKNKKIVRKVYDKLISMKQSNYKINNDIESLNNQKNYFLEKEIKNSSDVECNVYKGIMVHANSDIKMCPVKNNILYNVNNDPHVNKDFTLNLLNEQNNAKDCQMKNCHFVLNCKFS